MMGGSVIAQCRAAAKSLSQKEKIPKLSQNVTALMRESPTALEALVRESNSAG